MKDGKIQYADDDTSSVVRLARMRAPSLLVGLVLGMLLSFVTSKFENVLVENIQIAFFIPFVVYMASAVGAQTQNIYVRDLKSGKASFRKYLIKESLLGAALGVVFSLASGFIAWVWLGSGLISTAVGLSMFFAVLVAPLVALLVTEVLQLERTDPAVGSGPIATVIQDTLSILIYGFIASAILL